MSERASRPRRRRPPRRAEAQPGRWHGWRPRPDGHGHARREVAELRPLGQAAAAAAATRAHARRPSSSCWPLPASLSPQSDRRSSATRPTSSSPGFFGKQMPVRSHPGAGRRRSCGPRGRTQQADLIAGMNTSCPARASTSPRSAGCCSSSWRSTSSAPCSSGGPGLDPRRGRQLAPSTGCAGRCRGQAQPPAAALLRRPASRRAAQPGHQRHRQRRSRACSRRSASCSPRCSPSSRWSR